jgi:predicted enzyme related to lactoylglutathione lyase
VRLARAIPAEPEQPTPGRFFWMEYLANDADSAVAFYSSLAGYESGVTQTEHGIAYHVLRRGRSRAGVLKSPFDGVRPVWLPYVLVDDPAALAARVASLGGRVILAPRPEIRRGSLAVVADPSGAALALQKYPF